MNNTAPSLATGSSASMDAVFQALAHDSRRRMLDLLKENPGVTVGEMALEFDVSRIAVMKHLAVLEDANLLVSEKEGRSRRLYINLIPIQMIHDRWTTEYSAFWSGQVTRIKYLAEARQPVEKEKNKKKGRGYE